MRIHPYLRVLPRVRLYLATRPRAGCFASSSLVVALLVLLTSVLTAQVPSTTELHAGTGVARVGNPTTGSLHVTVELRERFVTGTTVTVGREVQALVTPAVFTLQPGEVQTVRIKLREPVAPGTILGLVVTFDPQPSKQEEASVQLVVRTRLVLKAVVQ